MRTLGSRRHVTVAVPTCLSGGRTQNRPAHTARPAVVRAREPLLTSRCGPCTHAHLSCQCPPPCRGAGPEGAYRAARRCSCPSSIPRWSSPPPWAAPSACRCPSPPLSSSCLVGTDCDATWREIRNQTLRQALKHTDHQ